METSKKTLLVTSGPMLILFARLAMRALRTLLARLKPCAGAIINAINVVA